MSKGKNDVLVIAKTEYVRWITNPRMLVMGVLLIFVRTLAVTPLLEHSEKMGMPLNMFEPFIAMGNSNVLVLLMPCVFMLLISDYPIMNGNVLMLIHRTEKVNWYAGQLLFQVMAVSSFLLFMCVGGTTFSRGQIMNDWSDVVTKYVSYFPNEAESFACQLLPSNLYNQMSVFKALFHTTFLFGLHLLCLSAIIYLFQLINAQPLGLFMAAGVLAAGVITCSLNLKCMWCFPLANTIVWLHYDPILRMIKPPVWHSYLYFAVLAVTLNGINFRLAKRYQFFNTERIR